MDPATVTLDDLAGPRAADVLAELRRDAPLTRLPAIDGWLVTGHATAVAVMRDDRSFTVDDPRFSTAQVVGPSMLSLDGAAHRRHRAPFVEPFRPARVEGRFAGRVDTLAAELVDRIRPDGHADLRAAVAGPLSVAVVAGVLGLPPTDSATVLRWYAAIVQAVSDITAGRRPAPDAATAMTALREHVTVAVSNTDSLLGEAVGALETDEIVADAAVMMFGGIETTEGMIANALVHLLDHDDVRSAVTADPSLDAVVVEESLRLEPAAAVVDRYATADVEIAGVTVPRGDLVRVSIAGANRDPAVFAEPDRFLPTRPDLRQQLAFARGPHVCIAMDLARLEARRAVRAVLDGLPGLRAAGDVPRPHGLVFRKPDEVPVRFEVGTTSG
ncbi:cytochrome P450 [Jatrophihabitans sp. YIM 134969]